MDGWLAKEKRTSGHEMGGRSDVVLVVVHVYEARRKNKMKEHDSFTYCCCLINACARAPRNERPDAMLPSKRKGWRTPKNIFAIVTYDTTVAFSVTATWTTYLAAAASLVEQKAQLMTGGAAHTEISLAGKASWSTR